MKGGGLNSFPSKVRYRMHFKAVAVDDDKNALSLSLSELNKNSSVSEAVGFVSSKEALNYIKNHYIPVVLLDIRMPEMDGITLAEKILSINPKTNIIFVTTYSHYLPQAFSIHASGYIMKPLDKDKLNNEIANLRFPLEEKKMGFYASTFGSFSLSYDGESVNFEDEKDRELMAYLLNRNGIATSKEKIREDLGYTIEEIEASLDHLFSMFSTLGEDGVLFKTRKGYFLDTSMVPSDVSEALDGVMEAKYLFAGEYLTPYKWAQERRKELISLL